MQKVLQAVFVACLIVVGVIGCAQNQGGAAAPETFFINPKSIGPAYWAAAQKGVIKAGQDLKVKVIFNAPTEADSAKQINMIQDMLTQHVTGMGVSPNDAQAVGPIFKKALGQGTKVVTWDSDAPGTERQYYLAAATDKYLGESLAEELAQQIGGKGKIAFMVAGLGAENQIAKTEAAKAYLAQKYPAITIVTTVASNDDSQKAFVNAQNLLKAYPDLRGIIGFAGGEPPAAGQAVEQAVKSGAIKQGQVAVTGIAVPSVVKQYIKDGTIQKIIIWDPIKLGYATVYVLDQLAQNKSITNNMEIPTVGKITLDGKNIFIGTIEITSQNVDSFSF
jgi:ABC-type sugar transport system substrate-binding protein